MQPRSQARPAGAGARGPIGRQPELSPSGYRISDRRRFELRMAALFTGKEALQDVIDLAVIEFLDRLSEGTGFLDALAAAEAEQRRRANIDALKDEDPLDGGLKPNDSPDSS